jgi:hypothetical protein
MVQCHSSWMRCWSLATVSGVVQLMGLPVCWSSSMDVWLALNRACHSNTRVWLMLSSQTLIQLLPGSPSHFFWDFHKIWCTLAVPLSDPLQNHIRPDTTSMQTCVILYTDSQDMLVLTSTVASHYNCCTDGSTSPGNYGYHLISIYHRTMIILPVIDKFSLFSSLTFFQQNMVWV